MKRAYKPFGVVFFLGGGDQEHTTIENIWNRKGSLPIKPWRVICSEMFACWRTSLPRDVAGLVVFLPRVSLWVECATFIPRELQLHNTSDIPVCATHLAELRWRAAGQLDFSRSLRVLSHCKVGRASWKTKGGMGRQPIRQVCIWQAFCGQCTRSKSSQESWSMFCEQAGDGWYFENHRPRLLHRRDPVGKSLKRPSN